eukprot:COSAG01_NODE_592_length_15109_cov_39.247435_13_plen_117_part_00
MSKNGFKWLFWFLVYMLFMDWIDLFRKLTRIYLFVVGLLLVRAKCIYRRAMCKRLQTITTMNALVVCSQGVESIHARAIRVHVIELSVGNRATPHLQRRFRETRDQLLRHLCFGVA